MDADQPPGVRYAQALRAADVGSRVVLRRRLSGVGPTGAQALGDVLGDLESWADGTLAVRTRTGELVEVAEADVVAGKPVPPAPPRRPRATG